MLSPLRDVPLRLLLGEQVDLGEGDDLRQAVEPRAVAGELAPDGPVVRLRIPLRRRDLDQVDEQPAALEMGEELVPEAGALGGALDQPGDVGEHQLAVVQLDRPQVGLDGGERVAGDLRVGAGQPGEQRGLAGVRQADEADVGEQLQPQLDLAGLALEPALGEARRLPGRGREALVAVAAGAAARHDQPLPVGEQLGLRAVQPVDDGARRDRDHPVLPALAVLALALAVLAAAGAEVPAAPERGEVAALGVADEHDVAAAAAVAAVGPAARHVRLAAKADHAVAAAAALDVDLRSVEEHAAKLA